jgi:hypothetical protein
MMPSERIRGEGYVRAAGDGQGECAEPDRDEQVTAGGARSCRARGRRRERCGPREARHAGGDQGIADDAPAVAATPVM